MSKDKMTQEYKDIIVRAVDRAVQRTGYPVTHAVLKAINVTKAQAKKLVYDGVLTSVDMAVKGQLLKGYYVTGGIYPKKLLTFEQAQARKAEEEATIKKVLEDDSDLKEAEIKPEE